MSKSPCSQQWLLTGGGVAWSWCSWPREELLLTRVHFPPRIVAARLNGSLDFFSLETHTSFNHLQFRGKRASHTLFKSSPSRAPLQKSLLQDAKPDVAQK